MDWEDLRHFAALAESGSLSAAARSLGVEHATVARRVAALEKHLALRLVDRRGRRLTLTEDGLRLATELGPMQHGAFAIARLAAGARGEIAGEVTISAPPNLAAVKLVGPLGVLQTRHPRLVLRMLGEFSTAALDKREADISVRLTRPIEGDLTIRKLGDVSFFAYATAAYLRQTSAAGWRFIGYPAPMDQVAQQGALRELAAGRPFAFVASTMEIQLAAVRAGMGIAMLPDFLVAAGDGLVRVEPERPAMLREVWMAVHSDLRSAPSVRAVVEAIEMISVW